MRLVGRVDVAPSLVFDHLLDPDARLVVVAPVLDHFRAVRAHRRVLVGIVADGHDDAAADAVHAAGERDRLAVIAGAGADDAAAAILGRELREQVQAAANLERAGWIVILVLDPRLAPEP